MNPQYEILAKCLLPTHMLEWFELTNVEVKPKENTAAKVHKFPESPKSPSKIPCLSGFQVGHPLGNVKTAEVRRFAGACASEKSLTSKPSLLCSSARGGRLLLLYLITII